MESASVDDVTDPRPPERADAEGGRRSVWVVLGFVVLGLVGAVAGVAGYLRQSELLAESEPPAEADTDEPFVAYAGVPAVSAEPLLEAEPEWVDEPLGLHVVDAAGVVDAADPVETQNVVAEDVVEKPVSDVDAEEVMAVDVPALDEAAPKEVPSESGESRIDFEPAALFADPLAMRDRRGSLRR
jgi:hypothetical protein